MICTWPREGILPSMRGYDVVDPPFVPTVRRQIDRYNLFEFRCGVTLRVKKPSII